ncbi:MAG TPA: hypothetical protein ENK51_07835 [Gammaproteobacteria bacterium]|nr:hypothetical protein [Gammaproteobacteria bacterium]
MRPSSTKNLRHLIQASLTAAILASGSALAADDPSIKGDLRSNIQAAMDQMIKERTVNGTFKFYDQLKDKVYDLKLVELHDGIVKKGDYYVSCADFVDSRGNKVDMDFLVLPSDGKLLATQAIMHKVDGKKRKYHLED